MTVIELSDEQAAALKAKAAAAGLTLEAWLQQLAGAAETEPVEHPLQTAAEIVLGRMRNVPPEIMATMPKDGGSQHDHYIYGWPKKEA
jgi:plasmid stability protein